LTSIAETLTRRSSPKSKAFIILINFHIIEL
jgi:hypothetical protein